MGKPTYWKRWAGGVSGAALGTILGGVPGFVAGAKAGYSIGKKRDYDSVFLPQNSTSMVTPRSVRRRLSFATPASGRSGGSWLFTPRSTRSYGSRYSNRVLRRRSTRKAYRLRRMI